MIKFKKYLIFTLLILHIDNVNSDDLKIAVLRYGSVNWELDVLHHHNLHKKFNLDLKKVQVTNKDAAAIAFLSGTVDIFVTDWIWVSKQRYQGKKFSFLPYSSASGGLLIKKKNKIDNLRDLKDKKIGIAGSSIDKSWLFFKAYFQKEYGEDATKFFKTYFAAPPLINGLLKSGELDAGINYWNYAAILETQGFQSIVLIRDILPELGIDGDLPLIGYVFKESLAEENIDLLKRFLDATKEARNILESSDKEWFRIKKLTGAKNNEMLVTLRDGFRKGIPKSKNEILTSNIEKAYEVLHDIGGKKIVGEGKSLAEGTIWNDE